MTSWRKEEIEIADGTKVLAQIDAGHCLRESFD